MNWKNWAREGVERERGGCDSQRVVSGGPKSC